MPKKVALLQSNTPSGHRQDSSDQHNLLRQPVNGTVKEHITNEKGLMMTIFTLCISRLTALEFEY